MSSLSFAAHIFAYKNRARARLDNLPYHFLTVPPSCMTYMYQLLYLLPSPDGACTPPCTVAPCQGLRRGAVDCPAKGKKMGHLAADYGSVRSTTHQQRHRIRAASLETVGQAEQVVLDQGLLRVVVVESRPQQLVRMVLNLVRWPIWPIAGQHVRQRYAAGSISYWKGEFRKERESCN